MTHDDPRRNLLVAVLAALALLAAAVAALPLLLERSPAPPVADEALAGEIRELRLSQERTAEVLGRLESLLGARLEAPAAAAAPGERAPVGELPPQETFEELVKSLDLLRGAIEREANETQSLIRAAPAFGGESLLDVRERRTTTDWAALADLERHWRQDEDAADRSQYFQTSRDLLEVYGPPTAIYRPKGGLLFYYRREPEGMPGPQWYFRLQDGMVIEFFLEDYEEEEGDS